MSVTSHYTYDDDGRRISSTDGSGAEVDYQYDTGGLALPRPSWRGKANPN